MKEGTTYVLSARLLSSVALTAVSRLIQEGKDAPGGRGNRYRVPWDIGFSCLDLWLQSPADCRVKPWAGAGPLHAHSSFVPLN